MIEPTTDQATVQPVTGPPLLRTEGLTRHFKIGGGLHRRRLHAVPGRVGAVG
jgi:hypothetical protein